jgi:hypothetical protein
MNGVGGNMRGYVAQWCRERGSHRRQSTCLRWGRGVCATVASGVLPLLRSTTSFLLTGAVFSAAVASVCPELTYIMKVRAGGTAAQISTHTLQARRSKKSGQTFSENTSWPEV